MVRLTADIQVASDLDGVPGEEIIQNWIAATVAVAGKPADTPIEVAVRVVDSEEMQAINRRYREQDRTTNVLSFPAGEIEGLPDSEALPLGDVVVCAPVVAQEADRQGKQVHDHWGHMLVHGTLHLLGYDHESDADAAEMEALEVKILAAGGVPNPYESRR